MYSSAPYLTARALAAATLALLLAACATPPSKPPPPKPRTTRAEPPPATLAAPPSEVEPAPAATLPAYAEPSADAAEVEVEEIEVDAAGRPRPGSAAARAAEARTTRPSGGGAPLAQGAHERARDSASGAPTTAAKPGGAGDFNVGPRMAIGAGAADDAALDELDLRLRRARIAADAERAAAPGAPSGRTDGRGQLLSEPAARGAGGAAATSTGRGNTPDLSGEEDPPGTRQALGAEPSFVPEQRDDDILARQLREAAEQEPDAVLREKLWEEYRRYKAGL